ncbi:MAG: radical SAM protein [Endomicrobiaceae bacterium]|nr:radical SAM protein [Endomicrobiaceae bacterium]
MTDELKYKSAINDIGILLELLKDFRQSNQFSKAEDLINKNKHLLSESSELNFELANIYVALGKIDKAIEIFEKLIQNRDFDITIAVRELIKLYKIKGKYKKAVDCINIAVEKGNDNLDLYIEKIIQQRLIPDGKSAIETLQNLKKIKNNKSESFIKNIESVESSRQVIAPYRVFFTWGMHYQCNYNCTYCYAPKPHDITFDNNKNNKALYLSTEQLVDSWKFVFDKYGTSRIRLDGGEPTIYPNFYYILKELLKMHRLQINTNLSFDVKEFCDNSDPQKVRIDASLHCEYTKLDDYVKKLEYLKKHGYKLVVSYVAYPDFINNIPLAKKIIQSELNIPFLIHPYSGFYNDRQYPASYNEDEKNIIYNTDYKSITELTWRAERKGNYKPRFGKEKDIKLTEKQIAENESIKQMKQIENKNDNEFKLCEMGRMYARIYPNGNVYRCCAYDGNTYLGNLFDKTIKLLDRAEKCYNTKDCRCWRCMIPGEESRWLNTWMDDWEISF